MDRDHGFHSWAAAAILESGRLDARFYNPDHLRLLQSLDKSAVESDDLGELLTHLAHVTGYESSKHMDFVDDPRGVKVVEAMNVGDGLIEGKEWKRISRDGYEGLPRHQLKQDDVVFSKDGTLGNCALVTNPILPAVASRHVFRMTPKSDRVDSGYLAVWLSSSAGRTQTAYRQAGAVQGTIITPEVAAFRVLLPNYDVQKAIGNKLRRAQRQRELAAHATAQFARWLDNATGENQLGAQYRSLLQHVPANTCPDSVWAIDVDVADRVDPWPHHIAPRTVRAHLNRQGSFRKFNDLFVLVSSERNRIAPPPGNGAFYVSILDVGSDGFIDWSNAEQMRYSSTGVEVLAGDILYSSLNPQEARIGFVPQEHTALTAASTEFAVLRLKADSPDLPFLLSAVLRSDWVRVQASFLTRSSSLSRRRLHDSDFSKLLIPWTDNDAESTNALLGQAANALSEADEMIQSAKRDVEALIAGTLDDGQMLVQGQQLAEWLVAHPAPDSLENM
jgi:hypothetical protein